MKKLLTLLSLTVAISAFGANNETSMKINAVVLQPLNVSHNGDIDFGNVIQNTTATVDTPKVFTVNGSAGAHVTLTINHQPANSFTQTTIKDSNDNRITVFLDDARLSSKTSTLDDQGNLTFSFKPRIYVPENQAPGTYTGSLVARVQYQ